MSIEMEKSRYEHLLDAPDVKRWYQNVSRGSQVAADVYLCRVGSFCNKHGLSPVELVDMDERT